MESRLISTGFSVLQRVNYLKVAFRNKFCHPVIDAVNWFKNLNYSFLGNNLE
jgi:hypothetical protein